MIRNMWQYMHSKQVIAFKTHHIKIELQILILITVTEVLRNENLQHS